jgi:hypothetical protein
MWMPVVDSLASGSFGHIKRPPRKRPRSGVILEPFIKDLFPQFIPRLFTISFGEFIKEIMP